MIAYYDALLAGIPTVMLAVIGITTMTDLGMQTGVGLAALASVTLIIHGTLINPPVPTHTHHDHMGETEPPTPTNTTK